MMNGFISWVVVTYNQNRELPRTLYSMSPKFQDGVSADDYEVIVVDNGSARPPRAKDFADLGLNLTIVQMENPTHSPTPAVNRGLDLTCGAAMGVTIDGARMMSPGVLRRTREALAHHERAVVGTHGRYLGPTPQRYSMRRGYNQKVEDDLLEIIDWKNNGYRLFDISLFDETSRPTWMSQIAETNTLFMRRQMWAELGGFDERFSSPGGGFVNLDAWKRAVSLPDARPIILLGEATFHQFHGGAATNKPRGNVDPMKLEYQEIRGEPFERPTAPHLIWGTAPATRYFDELYWEKGQVNASRMVDGLMAGILDPTDTMLPVDENGNLVQDDAYKARVARTRRRLKRNAAHVAELAAIEAAKPPEPVSDRVALTAKQRKAMARQTAAGTTPAAKKQRAATSAAPQGAAPKPTVARKVAASLPPGAKKSLKKVLGR